MTTEEHLSEIDALAMRPFPETTSVDATGSGGPEHHVRELQVSRDFWDDEDGQAWIEAEAELRASLDDLVARLTTRWGNAFVVDLGPYLSAGCEGEPVPEPLDHLSQQARPPASGRRPAPRRLEEHPGRLRHPGRPPDDRGQITVEWWKQLTGDIHVRRVPILAGDARNMRHLLRRGANPEGRDPDGTTPLYLAAVQGEAEVARLLMEAGACPDTESRGPGSEGTPLCAAACWGHTATVRELLAHGADPDLREDQGAGWSPLDWAERGPHPDTAEVLRAAGARPTTKAHPAP